jgi:choline dehydrogenase-like flavoprotein
VSAGAIASSELLLRSKVGNENIGHSIGFHPAPAVLARYEEEINGFAGIPMGYHVDQFRRIEGNQGFLIEGIFMQPAQFSLLLPQFFPKDMRNYPHYTMAGILLWDEQAGVVRLNADRRAVFFYDLTPTDRETLQMAMKKTAEAYLRTSPAPLEVITSHRIPTILHTTADLGLIDSRGFGPADLTLGSAHPQGGNRMGSDPEVYAVSPNFQLFDPKGTVYPNIYVCDASVFPSTVGVNPQISVMALALELGKRLEVPRGLRP